MLSEEQVAAFKRDGYVNGGAALDDDEVETLRAELARVIEDDGKDDVKQPVL